MFSSMKGLLLTLGCIALLAQLPHVSLAIDSTDTQTDAKEDATKDSAVSAVSTDGADGTDGAVSADKTTDDTTKTSVVDVNEHK